MAIVTINDTNLTDIATAIRGKNGTENTYKPSEMAAAISAIEVGGGSSAGYAEYWGSFSNSTAYSSKEDYFYIPCEGINSITFKYDADFGTYSFPVTIEARKGYKPTGFSNGAITWTTESGYTTETILSRTQGDRTGVEATIDVSAFTGVRLTISYHSISSTNSKKSAVHIYDVTFN